MEKTTKLKVFVLSLAMALGMLSPATVRAQGGNDNLLQFDNNDVGRDGFATTWALYNSSFGSSSYSLNNLGFGNAGYNVNNQGFGGAGYNINNQTFGDPAPLGSGLLILTAVGAGYAAVHRKR